MPKTIDHLRPEGLHHNPAFSQAVIVRGPHRTIYVGGQNAVDGEGKIVGKGDVAAQTGQVLHNLELALQAGGATLENLVRWTVHVVQGQKKGFEVFRRRWPREAPPPTITVLYVAGLAHSDFLVEIDAVAVVPETA